MTVAEMLNEIDLRLDEADAAWFNTDEKLAFLNIAQLSWVKDNADQYDANDRVRQNLAGLTERPPITFVQVGATPEWRADVNALVLPFSSLTMRVLALLPSLTKGTKSNYHAVARARRMTEWATIFRNPHTRPSLENPSYLVEHDNTTNLVRRISLWVDSPNASPPYAVVSSAQIVVLRTPRNMAVTPSTVECELPSFVHNEILSLAITRMLESVESARTAGHQQVQED